MGRQRSREREELIASISHELRTPLTSVVGFTEVLLSGDAGILNEEQAALLQRVASNGDRLLELIEGLLSASSERMARCEAGAAVDVADVILEVVGQAESSSNARPRRTSPEGLPRLSA
jgi:signal transduction histidine kinase